MSTKRIKDAGFVQQHIEKMLLAAGVFVFLIAGFLFIVGNPFAIELNNKTYDNPSDAVNVLVQTDKRIENGLLDSKPLPEVETPNFRENFMAMKERPRDIDGLVESVSYPGLTEASTAPPLPEASLYALVYPPVPTNIDYKSGTDVLDKDFDPQITDAYYTLWNKPPDAPGDFTMFIASGDFDIGEWIDRLKADPTGADREAIKIPGGIWAQRFGIAGVALLRERQDPLDPENWIDREIVAPLPGQVRILPADKAEANTAIALAQIAQLRTLQSDLAQPELPRLTDFEQAVPPGGEDGDDLLRALADEKLGPTEKKIVEIQERIAEFEERRARDRDRENPSRPTTPRRPSGREQDDRFGDTSGGTGRTTERRDPFADRIERLREEIARLQPKADQEKKEREQKAELERRREEERRRREALQGERNNRFPGAVQGAEDLARIQGLDLQRGSTLRVWAADPTMQPGETYRYKLLVAVINPLYAVPRLTPDQLEANQHRAALLPTQEEIDAMPWTEPITVEPEYQFFFTRGSETNADIDIYRRYDGQLHHQDFDGTPGDMIGSVIEYEDEFGNVKEVDMGIGAILVDIERRRDVFTNTPFFTMVFTDEQGNIFERSSEVDKTNSQIRILSDEVRNGSEKVLRPDPDARPDGGDRFDGFVPGGAADYLNPAG